MFKNNIIISLPKISEFEFNSEWITFIGICIMLVALVIFTITGYKHFVSSIIIFSMCALGYLGLVIGKAYTDSQLALMVIVISFAFLGFVLMYLFGSMIFIGIKGTKIKNSIVKNMYIISSLLGSITFSLIIYSFVFNNLSVCIGICLILFIGGFVYQKIQKEKQIKFYTYEDLYLKKIADNN